MPASPLDSKLHSIGQVLGWTLQQGLAYKGLFKEVIAWDTSKGAGKQDRK